MTWMNSRMGAGGQALWIGGFNLLPYRQRDARRARRRCLLEWLGAALIGCVAVLAVAGWQAFEQARLEVQRVCSEHELVRLAGPLAEHASLRRDAEERSKRAARAAALTGPLNHLLDLLDTLSRTVASDVILQQLRQRVHETEVLATSKDALASTAWLKQLSMVRGVIGSEVTDLHPLPRTSGDAAANGGGAIEFVARLRWDEREKKAGHPAVSTSGRSHDAKAARGTQ
jgi:Tfp pilus assembly protein PilN